MRNLSTNYVWDYYPDHIFKVTQSKLDLLPGVNPEIRRKIHELIGEDAPNILKDFFDEILKIEAKQEITMSLSPKELESTYSGIVQKIRLILVIALNC